MTNGLRPYPIALDNYFVNREDTPRDVNGDYDYESLYALDLKKFEEDLKALLRGEEIDLPSFNFSTGQREYKGDKLRIDEHTILILEGIHALNPELTPQIPAENKYKIYVSALTTILWTTTTGYPQRITACCAVSSATSTIGDIRHAKPSPAGPACVPEKTNGSSLTRRTPM